MSIKNFWKSEPIRVIEVVLVAFGVASAVYIGVKQNNIGVRQVSIDSLQLIQNDSLFAYAKRRDSIQDLRNQRNDSIQSAQADSLRAYSRKQVELSNNPSVTLTITQTPPVIHDQVVRLDGQLVNSGTVDAVGYQGCYLVEINSKAAHPPYECQKNGPSYTITARGLMNVQAQSETKVKADEYRAYNNGEKTVFLYISGKYYRKEDRKEYLYSSCLYYVHERGVWDPCDGW